MVYTLAMKHAAPTSHYDINAELAAYNEDISSAPTDLERINAYELSEGLEEKKYAAFPRTKRSPEHARNRRHFKIQSRAREKRNTHASHGVLALFVNKICFLHRFAPYKSFQT